MMKNRKWDSGSMCLLAAFAMGLACGGVEGATRVTQYTEDYIHGPTGNVGNRYLRGYLQVDVMDGVDVNNDGSSENDRILYLGFDLDEPLNPPDYTTSAQQVGYDTSLPSAIFYGGIVARYANTQPTTWSQATIQEEYEVSLITNSVYWPDANPTRYPEPWDDDLVQYNGVMLWQQDGFLNGGNYHTTTFGVDSMLSVEVIRYWNVGEARFVARDGDQFYVSETTLAGEMSTRNDDPALTQINPTEVRWAEYNPSGPIDIDFDQTTAVWDYHEFLDVTAVGVYYEQDAWTNDKSFFKFTSMLMDADLLPLELPGDFNQDGVVDVIDLGILAGGWQQSVDYLHGDANEDGLVDVIDLGIVAGNWQMTAGAMGVTVPEPGLMLVSGVVVAWAGRRKHG